jgi:hypothetical protein
MGFSLGLHTQIVALFSRFFRPRCHHAILTKIHFSSPFLRHRQRFHTTILAL